MRFLSVFFLLADLVFVLPARAEMLCVRHGGSVSVRTQCRANESLLDPKTLGLGSLHVSDGIGQDVGELVDTKTIDRDIDVYTLYSYRAHGLISVRQDRLKGTVKLQPYEWEQPFTIRYAGADCTGHASGHLTNDPAVKTEISHDHLISDTQTERSFLWVGTLKMFRAWLSSNDGNGCVNQFGLSTEYPLVEVPYPFVNNPLAYALSITEWP